MGTVEPVDDGPEGEAIRPPAGAPDLVGRVSEVFNAIGTAWIFGILILVNTDVAGRYFFDSPVRGVAEIVSLSIVGIVFLQLPSTLRRGRLTTADALFSKLQAARPRVAMLLGAAYDLIGCALFVVLLQASYPYFTVAWEHNLYVGAAGDFTAPTWPIKLIVLIGCAAMIVQFLALALVRLRAAFAPSLRAVGQ